MSKTVGGGAVKMSPNVAGKRLGVKKFASEEVQSGNILVKQRGSVYYPGKNTKISRDFSIHALSDGVVSFRRMTGAKRGRFYVDVN